MMKAQRLSELNSHSERATSGELTVALVVVAGISILCGGVMVCAVMTVIQNWEGQ